MKINKQEILFRQGDRAPAFFIIVRGEIKLYQSSAAGNEGVIDILTKGESVALADIFNGGLHHTTAEAVSSSRLLCVRSEQLHRCMREAPDVAQSVMASTFDHYHRLMRQVAQLKTQTALQRVSDFLVSLCPLRAKSCIITLPYGKRLIASQLGMTPEALSRTFASLKSVGVNVRETYVEVSDVDRLRCLAVDNQR